MVVGAALFIGVGCSSGVNDETRPASKSEDLTGTVIVDTTSTSGFISAVGQLDNNCSGTLIAPDVVLSAGHCMPPDLAAEPLTFFLPQAPSPGKYKISRAARAGDAGTGSECRSNSRSHDLALFWLETPVPSTIAAPQELFSGQLSKEIWHLDGNYLAGFGNTPWPTDKSCRPPGTPQGGLRSFGRLQATVHYERDKDDGFWEVYHCHDYRAEYSYHTNPMTLQGDSGGPMFARMDDGS